MSTYRKNNSDLTKKLSTATEDLGNHFTTRWFISSLPDEIAQGN